MENRNGLAVNAALTRATGTAEREAALAMLGCHKSKRRRGRPEAVFTVAVVAYNLIRIPKLLAESAA